MGLTVAEPLWWQLTDAELQDHVSSPGGIALRAMPGFHAAMEHSMRGALRLNDLHPTYSRTMNDAALAVLGLLALYLDATGGLWHQRLRDIAGFSGVLGAGRATALLMRMQSIGFVEAVREREAGAPKFYRPTKLLTAAYQARLRLELEAMSKIAPEMGDLLPRYDAPGGFVAFMREYGRVTLEAVRATASLDPPLQAIASRRAGLISLIALVDAAATEAGHFPAAGQARVSATALSERFGVSRGQVLNILREAAATGLFVRGSTERDGQVQPALVEAFEQIYAVTYVIIGSSAHAALR